VRQRVLRLPPGQRGTATVTQIPGDGLVNGVHAFFAERVFGPDRAALLAELLKATESTAADDRR
jgi:hypothetical protein